MPGFCVVATSGVPQNDCPPERRQREMIPEVWQRDGQEVAAETLTGL